MNGYFITGTDTGVGKTLAAAVLTYVLKACYWKPIQSGIDDAPGDTITVRQLTELPANHFLSPVYELRASLSPDQAALHEGININIDDIQLPAINNPLIVEGAGGGLCPYK